MEDSSGNKIAYSKRDSESESWKNQTNLDDLPFWFFSSFDELIRNLKFQLTSEKSRGDTIANTAEKKTPQRI